MNDAWIPYEWMRLADFENDDLSVPVTITAMHSPFYKGTRYAVRKGKSCLNTDGAWEYEPIQSERNDDFYRRCRFLSFEAAVKATDRKR